MFCSQQATATYCMTRTSMCICLAQCHNKSNYSILIHLKGRGFSAYIYTLSLYKHVHIPTHMLTHRCTSKKLKAWIMCLPIHRNPLRHSAVQMCLFDPRLLLSKCL